MHCGVVLYGWRYHASCLSAWILQYCRRQHIEDVRVYRVPCGDLRSRYHADDGGLLGDLRCGVLLSCWRDDGLRGRDGWRLPTRCVQYRRWWYDVRMYPVSSGDLRKRNHADDC